MSQRSDLPPRTFGPNGIVIAPGIEQDLPGIVDILNHVAASSTASFVSRPVTVADRREWFGQFSTTGPYRLFVARRDDEQLLGFACSQRYRELDAFRETVEVSISLDASCRGRGVGSSLYHALFESMADAPIHVALAGIAMPNDASVALHRKFGFTDIGVFREYAVKNGHYISSLWMQRLQHLARLTPGPAVAGGPADDGARTVDFGRRPSGPISV